MKKYIAPSMKVVNIQNETILAGSNFGVDKQDNDYTTASFGARGRNAHYFEEEEEFEY